MAGACSGDDAAGKGKGTAEKTASAGNVAGGHSAANDGAGENLAVNDDVRKDDDREAARVPKLLKKLRVASLAMAEAEVLADKDRADAKVTHQDLINEFFGREARKFVSEGQNDGGLHACGCEASDTLCVGGEAKWGRVWAEDFGWQGIEGEYRGNGVQRLSLFGGGAENGLVAEMDAVEVADGESAAAARGGVVLGPGNRRREDANVGSRKTRTLRTPGCGTPTKVNASALKDDRFAAFRASGICTLVGVGDGHLESQAVVGQLDVRVAEGAEAFVGFSV